MQNIDDASDFKIIALAFTSQIKPALISCLRNPAITALWLIALYNASNAYFLNIDFESHGGRYGQIIASEQQTRAVFVRSLYWLISLTAGGFALVLMALRKIKENRPADAV